MRKVTYAKIHGDLFIPGLGGLGSTLPSQSKTVNLQMSYGQNEDGAEGLFLVANVNFEIFVPASSVLLVVYAPREAKISKAG